MIRPAPTEELLSLAVMNELESDMMTVFTTESGNLVGIVRHNTRRDIREWKVSDMRGSNTERGEGKKNEKERTGAHYTIVKVHIKAAIISIMCKIDQVLSLSLVVNYHQLCSSPHLYRAS